MRYNIEKTAEYLAEKRSISNPQVLYEALNVGGIKYVTFRGNDVFSTAKWTKTSSSKEFYDFWKQLLGSTKITETGSTNICKGDVIVSIDSQENSSVLLYFVLDSEKAKTYTVIGDSQKRVSESFFYTDSCWLIRFSKINYSLVCYYNLLFKENLISNQKLFAKLLFSCCPEAKNKDGSKRKNADNNNLFSRFNALELQTEIERCVKNHRIPNSPLSQMFETMIFEGARELSQPTVTKLFQGSTRKYVDKFFKDKTNRPLFQERLSLVLQYVFLINLTNYKNLITIGENPCGSFTGYTTEIKEYITLSPILLDRARDVVRYITNEHIEAITSIFELCGYLFDSMGARPDKESYSKDEEYARFQELVDCYGTGTLDYYFALERNKENHYAAEALSAIYHFGRTFDGYEVKRDIEKSIKLLNSCKDYSVSARWSLAENFKKLAETFLGDSNKGSNDDQISNCLNMALYYYESCGNYPPALNSMSNVCKDKAINDASISIEDRRKNARKAIIYATRAAQSGWVYAFNNLYSLLSDKRLTALLEDDNGSNVIRNAYQILIPTEEKKRMKKCEERMNIVKRNLKKGLESRLPYNEGEYVFTFSYFDPIDDPANFLVVSACFGNRYGLNHLGIECWRKGKVDMAEKLFTIAATYGSWGYYNLAMYIFPDDSLRRHGLLLEAEKAGNEKAAQILKSEGRGESYNGNVYKM